MISDSLNKHLKTGILLFQYSVYLRFKPLNHLNENVFPCFLSFPKLQTSINENSKVWDFFFIIITVISVCHRASTWCLLRKWMNHQIPVCYVPRIMLHIWLLANLTHTCFVVHVKGFTVTLQVRNYNTHLQKGKR